MGKCIFSEFVKYLFATSDLYMCAGMYAYVYRDIHI